MTLAGQIEAGFEAVAGEINQVRSEMSEISGGRPSGMQWWDTRLAGNEETSLDVLVIGDSTGDGFSSTDPEKTYVRRLLREGANHTGRGRGLYYPASPVDAVGYYHASHNPWTKVGGTSDTSLLLGLSGKIWYSNTNGHSISGTFKAARFRVQLGSSSFTANARIYIDNVLVATVNTNNATNQTLEWTSSTMELADHIIRIENDGAGSFIIVEGVLVEEEPSNSFNVWPATLSGFGATHFATSFPASWESAVAKTNADLVVICIGVNDQTFARTPTQVADDYETIVNRVFTALGQNPSVLAVLEWGKDTLSEATWQTYVEAIRSKALLNGWAVADIDAVTGTRASDPYGLDADGVHPDQAGHGVWASVINKEVLKATLARRRVVIPETHTYAIQGAVTTSTVFPPFYVDESRGVLTLRKVTTKLTSGTATAKVRVNGVDEVTGISMTNAKATNDFADEAVSDLQSIDIVLTAAASAVDPSITFHFERIVYV